MIHPAHNTTVVPILITLLIIAVVNGTQLDALRAQQAPGAAKKDSDQGQLEARVRQIERQIVDMRVMIDTLHSLANGARRPPAPGFGASPQPPGRTPAPGATDTNSAARIAILETQIRALTSQVEKLTAKLRAGQSPAAKQTTPPPGATQPRSNQWQPKKTDQTRSQAGTQSPAAAPASSPRGRGFLALNKPSTGSGWATRRPGASTPPDANRTYLAAINLYNNDDFDGARRAIKRFVKEHPNHPQIPTAKFRLAQSNFKLRNYQAAATQFADLVRKYRSEPIAPDSYAMFAASLARAGRKRDACRIFKNMARQFPNDAAHMPPEAKSERRRLGC